MKKIFLSLVTVLACSIASAQSAIEGNWGMQHQDSGFVFDITFAISTNSITVTNVCTGLGTTATAQVTSTSSYTDTALTVNEAKQDRKSSGGLNCDVAVQPSTMNYSVQGSQLVLSEPGGTGTLVLTKK